MNLFRLAGDMTHLLSIVVLLLKIRTTKSCSGISLKTQELYVVVFVTRYLDIFTRYVSPYNTIMKLVFIGTSIGIVWYMKYHKVVKQTYNKNEDTFRHYILVLPCFVLALLFHRDFTVMEVLWTFSLYLEAVAILPQLVLLQRSRNIDNLTGNYVFLLGAYRALYILNWIYRYFLEDHRARWIRKCLKTSWYFLMLFFSPFCCFHQTYLSAKIIAWMSGVVQTALYADFFYYYIMSWKNHEKLKLPA